MTAASSLSPPIQAITRLVEDLDRPARLLVAISGGSDSAGLLLALSEVLAGLKHAEIRLFAATIDHALRLESADEAQSVASLCATLEIPHFIRCWDGDKPKAGISAAAREARYRLLLEVADEVDATAILTGHTFDDQMETVAMRAERSDDEANLGLAGMADAVLLDRRRWLLRPFLGISRADIREYLTTAGHGWIDDPSNLDPHYERVRMRQSLAERPPGHATNDAAKRRQVLSEKAADLVRDHLKLHHGVLAELPRSALAGEGPVLRYALSFIAAVLGGRPYVPKAESMDRVLAFLAAGMPGRMTAGRVIFDLRRDRLFMQRETRGILPLVVAAGETAVWDGRYRISNSADSDLTVSPAMPYPDMAVSAFPGMPKSIALRAASVMPDLATALPILAPFDRFLPQFELRLATQLAVLFGCNDFPRLPVKLSERKR